MTRDLELDTLIDGCLRGDRRAQQAVYRRFAGKMKVVCLRYIKDADSAQDVLQEGFIKVFQGIDKYKGAGSFEGWIRRIMVNLSIDHFRKSKRDWMLFHDENDAETWEDEPVEDDAEMLEYQFSASQIIEAMQKLSPAYRTIFNLYVFENQSHKDIAERLGINLGTSKSNFAKAKRNLKKILLKEFGNTYGKDADAV